MELLAVLAITGILVGILLPAVQMVRESARRTECLNNVRQMALGLMNYEAQRGRLPSGHVARRAGAFAFQSWMQAILPFVEQPAAYEIAVDDYRRSPDPFHGHSGMQTVIRTFQCPSDSESGVLHFTHENRLVASTHYLGVNGNSYREMDGVFFADSAIRFADITDGLSNTLMIGERPPSPDFWYGWWYAGFGQEGTGSCDVVLGVRELRAMGARYLESCPDGPYQFEAGRSGRQCDTLHFWSHHPGGAVFAFADGSVRLIGYGANDILPSLATRAGNEIVQVPESP